MATTSYQGVRKCSKDGDLYAKIFFYKTHAGRGIEHEFSAPDPTFARGG
jgi:hypothetical protein